MQFKFLFFFLHFTVCHEQNKLKVLISLFYYAQLVKTTKLKLKNIQLKYLVLVLLKSWP